jgi:hypothetical protein
VVGAEHAFANRTVRRISAAEAVDPVVHCLQGRELRVCQLVLDDDHEVDVAVLVEVADCERSLKVGSREAVAEGRAAAADQLAEESVQRGIRSGLWGTHEQVLHLLYRRYRARH